MYAILIVYCCGININFYIFLSGKELLLFFGWTAFIGNLRFCPNSPSPLLSSPLPFPLVLLFLLIFIFVFVVEAALVACKVKFIRNAKSVCRLCTRFDYLWSAL